MQKSICKVNQNKLKEKILYGGPGGI